MVRLQDSILEHLHHHTFSNMFSNKIFETHHVLILSCFGPRVGVWLIIRPIFTSFWSDSLIFSTTLQIWLKLPHPSITNIPRCMCTHPVDLMGIHLLHCVHDNEHTNPLCSLWHLCCHCTGCWLPPRVRTTTCASFKHIQFLSSMSWHCAHQIWHSHLSWCCHCWPNTSKFISLILHHPRICCFWCGSSQIMKLSQPTPYHSIFPLSSGGILMFT
jgi:hypothetical protein